MLAVPITLVLGSLGFYFVGSGIGAMVTGVLGVTGVVERTDLHPVYALLLAPAMAAVGAAALAVLAGYFWLIARTVRELRR